MAPPAGSIALISCFMHRKIDRRLTAIIRSKSSSGRSARFTVSNSMAAAFTAKFSPPKVSTAARTIAATSSDFETSVRTKIASPPCSRTSDAVSSPPSTWKSATTTRAPAALKARAIERPMPPAPPVTIAILSVNHWSRFPRRDTHQSFRNGCTCWCCCAPSTARRRRRR